MRSKRIGEEIAHVKIARRPTRKEIIEARGMVDRPLLQSDIKLMDCWKGVGWHTNEILYGIFIGLQIAENRRKRE
jgi:hypothetical protein